MLIQELGPTEGNFSRVLKRWLLKLVICRLHFFPIISSLAGVSQQGTFWYRRLEHYHAKVWCSQGEHIAEQSPFSSFSPYQSLLSAFWLGYMAPTLSMAPGPQPGDHVKFLSLFSQVMNIPSQIHLSLFFFFFYCHHPNSGSFTFSCVILGALYSLPFPLVSSPFSPALYSLTLTLLVAPRCQVSQVKIFYCRIQGVLQNNSKPSLWPPLSFVPAKPFFILSPAWSAPAFALLPFLPWITSVLLETQLCSQE